MTHGGKKDPLRPCRFLGRFLGTTQRDIRGNIEPICTDQFKIAEGKERPRDDTIPHKMFNPRQRHISRETLPKHGRKMSWKHHLNPGIEQPTPSHQIQHACVGIEHGTRRIKLDDGVGRILGQSCRSLHITLNVHHIGQVTNDHDASHKHSLL